MEFLNEHLEYLWTNCDDPTPAIAGLAERLSREGEPFDAGQAYLFLAKHSFRVKYYDCALEEYLRFLDQVRADCPDDAPLLVLAYRKAGEACMHSSLLYRKPTLAEDYLCAAYAICKEQLPALAEKLVLICERLSFLLFSTAAEYRSEEMDRAIGYDREAIALLDVYFPNDSEWKSEFLRNLGYLHEQRGEREQAEVCYGDALNLAFQYHVPGYQRRFCS